MGRRSDRQVGAAAAAALLSAVLIAACSAGAGSTRASDPPAPPASDSPATAASGSDGLTPTPSASLLPSPTVSADPASTAQPRVSPGPVGLRVAGVLARDLRAPWGLAFLADGTAFVSERDSAIIRRIDADGRLTRVGEVAGVQPGGEGGLLGLAVDPRDERWLYAYYTGSRDNRVVRIALGDRLGRQEVLLDGIQKASNHDGGRIAFGPDGMLYVGTGDAGVPSRSQDRSSLNGKILRITPEGRVPGDNPFRGSAVWSLGHRNVQGIAWDSRGRMWASEFGQNTWDELNHIREGRNYGWPNVEGRSNDSRFVNPIVAWRPSQASPSGVTVVVGPRGESVLVAALRGRRVWSVPADPAARGAGARSHFAGDYGRIRTIARAPDGSVWLVTSNTDGRARPGSRDDRILRLSVS